MKSNVFSFGVLTLEIVTGRKNRCFQNGENIENLLSYVRIVTFGFNTLGLLCVQENEVDRPTMASVVRMLNSYSTTLPVPSPPAIFMNNSIESDVSIQRSIILG
jgi:hypothetical protein